MNATHLKTALRGSALYALLVLSLLALVVICCTHILATTSDQRELGQQRTRVLLAPVNLEHLGEGPTQAAKLDELELRWQEAQHQSIGELGLTVLVAAALLLALSVYLNDRSLEDITKMAAALLGVMGVVCGIIWAWPTVLAHAPGVWATLLHLWDSPDYHKLRLFLLSLSVSAALGYDLSRRQLLRHLKP